jgi:hypothetical protein
MSSQQPLWSINTSDPVHTKRGPGAVGEGTVSLGMRVQFPGAPGRGTVRPVVVVGGEVVDVVVGRLRLLDVCADFEEAPFPPPQLARMIEIPPATRRHRHPLPSKCIEAKYNQCIPPNK